MGAGACSAMGRFPFRAWRSEAMPETDGLTDAFGSKVVRGLSRTPSTTYGDVVSCAKLPWEAAGRLTPAACEALKR